MNSSYALRQVIREMSEQEAKSLLSLLFAHDGYSAEMHESLKKSLLEMSKKRTEVDYVKIRHIHIALGDSPGGSLKIALKAPEGRKPEHRVLVLRDALPFSVGPLWKLEEEEGREERRRWCMLHINMDDRDEYLLQGEEQFLEMRSRLEGIPDGRRAFGYGGTGGSWKYGRITTTARLPPWWSSCTGSGIIRSGSGRLGWSER
ncbi:DUF1835 domain-containing protein [Paenibacillus caseinilyticus]|uniref:DUF1835 domain-containing protein n=1 Tax=Paenibacillus mucilaginosus TaxID=61624 RepID=UPI001F4CBE0F|nr:DUF1835 domain-containing protein [Paenibacillus mucilaginosus]